MERLGFGAIRPVAGMAAMAALLLSSCRPVHDATGGMLPASVVASVFYWDKLQSGSPLFAEQKQLSHSSGDAAGEVHSSNRAAAPAAAAVASTLGLTAGALQAAITAAVVAVLGSDPGIDAPLVGAGLDSLGERGDAAQGRLTLLQPLRSVPRSQSVLQRLPCMLSHSAGMHDATLLHAFALPCRCG